jgi:hypothetical protein
MLMFVIRRHVEAAALLLVRLARGFRRLSQNLKRERDRFLLQLEEGGVRTAVRHGAAIRLKTHGHLISL